MSDEVTTNEIMDFLKEHMVTRDEVENIVDAKLRITESRILSAVDGIAKQNETLEHEFLILKNDHKNLTSRVTAIEEAVEVA
ncbi:hypothetical protein HOI18_00810 [Candidatus Uhrbacteria bacterium]|jgi:hypothetical protein|nr:hypothetical protein [Candidatus Uhrbacteria bacterium]